MTRTPCWNKLLLQGRIAENVLLFEHLQNLICNSKNHCLWLLTVKLWNDNTCTCNVIVENPQVWKQKQSCNSWIGRCDSKLPDFVTEFSDVSLWCCSKAAITIGTFRSEYKWLSIELEMIDIPRALKASLWCWPDVKVPTMKSNTRDKSVLILPYFPGVYLRSQRLFEMGILNQDYVSWLHTSPLSTMIIFEFIH